MFFSMKSVWTAPRVQFDPGFGVGFAPCSPNPKALILSPDVYMPSACNFRVRGHHLTAKYNYGEEGGGGVTHGSDY